uniref:Uncharacterized protein n=1 Tax=Trifolium medium TaxID=97028 RepID=A0A392NGD2_9FABA
MTFTRIIKFFSISKIQSSLLDLRIRRYAKPFGRKKGQKGKTLRDHCSEFEKGEREMEKATFQERELEEASEFGKSLYPKQLGETKLLQKKN